MSSTALRGILDDILESGVFQAEVGEHLFELAVLYF
ncbi:protein of unknown function [Pseudodesulfovibrio profundus]|uniref:Uncharacterized protein n=1 Tax=Pseudodesulfovibrio profundus TaxID=57320 RepID=A0A2C8FDB9_9BACT|nr:protein of unknown function [Pseudodesulfovibrio profundus]